MHMMVDLTDADLLARMRNFENHLVERKAAKDEKDWKKTAVAFANSAPIGVPAVLFIGVRDSGEIETPQSNLDELQKKFNRHMEKVYPRIAYVPKTITDNGRQALAIIIPGSELRPHFAGLSYVRRGSETIESSAEQFEELIASRTAKSREILKWKDKAVTLNLLNVEHAMHALGRLARSTEAIIKDCNPFYVTLQEQGSFPLTRVDICFDQERSRLAIEVRTV
jgi:predicted HTH transcriptional regulator